MAPTFLAGPSDTGTSTCTPCRPPCSDARWLKGCSLSLVQRLMYTRAPPGAASRVFRATPGSGTISVVPLPTTSDARPCCSSSRRYWSVSALNCGGQQGGRGGWAWAARIAAPPSGNAAGQCAHLGVLQLPRVVCEQIHGLGVFEDALELAELLQEKRPEGQTPRPQAGRTR